MYEALKRRNKDDDRTPSRSSDGSASVVNNIPQRPFRFSGRDLEYSLENKRRKQKEEPVKKIKTDGNNTAANIAIVQDFVDQYLANKTDGTTLTKLMIEYLPAVARTINKRYRANKQLEGELSTYNKALSVMSSRIFSTLLVSIIKNRDLDLGDPILDNDISRIIGLTLSMENGRMSDETIAEYAKLLAEIIQINQIDDLVDKFGMSEDSALETVVTFAAKDHSYTDNERHELVPDLVCILIDHVEALKETFNTETIVKFLQYILPDNDSKQGLKSCGDILTLEEPEEKWTPAEQELFANLIDAGYQRLNEYDIMEIESVLKYVASDLTKRKETGNKNPIVWNHEDIEGYSNIAKALTDLIGRHAWTEILIK